ncbi:hypothetical protein [Effusibacillus dendaii]|nr:hypothetical protein [Effusibacillus dendaii]
MKTYTDMFLEAVRMRPEQFEKMLQHIAESPFQSEYGDVWISKEYAEAVCTELYEMAVYGEMCSYHDFEKLKEDDSDLLKIVY